MIDEHIHDLKTIDKTHRIGQAICNALNIKNPSLYYMKDHELLNKLKDYKDKVVEVTNPNRR